MSPMKPMKDVRAEIEATLPAHADWPARGNVTVELAACVLRKQTLDEPTRDALEALCRKVDILKKVRVAYDDAWKKATQPEALPASDWPALIAGLLHAAGLERSNQPDGRGRALKLVNTAFNALDLYRERAGGSEAKLMSPLRGWAESSLKETLS